MKADLPDVDLITRDDAGIRLARGWSMQGAGRPARSAAGHLLVMQLPSWA